MLFFAVAPEVASCGARRAVVVAFIERDVGVGSGNHFRAFHFDDGDFRLDVRFFCFHFGILLEDEFPVVEEVHAFQRDADVVCPDMQAHGLHHFSIHCVDVQHLWGIGRDAERAFPVGDGGETAIFCMDSCRVLFAVDNSFGAACLRISV